MIEQTLYRRRFFRLWVTVICALFILKGSVALAAEDVASPLTQGRIWAVLIGIDIYEHEKEINSLRFSVADVRAVANTLKERLGACDTGDRRTMFLFTSISSAINLQRDDGTGEPMTEDIINCIRDLIVPNATQNDTLIFYFSGHGMIDDQGHSYLLTKRTVPSFQSLKGTSFSTVDLWNNIDSVKARRKLVILDCCRNSPTGAKAGPGDKNEGVSAKIDDFGKRGTKLVTPSEPAPSGQSPEMAVTLFACRKGEKSYEYPRRQQGFFSYFLVQGLSHPDLARDPESGNLTIRSLTEYLGREVPEAVRTELADPTISQTPWVRSEGSAASDWVLIPADRGEIRIILQSGRAGEELPADLELSVADSRCRSGQPARVPFDKALSLKVEGTEWELAEGQPESLAPLKREEKRREAVAKVWRKLSRGRLKVACLHIDTKQPVPGLFVRVGDALLSADQTQPYAVPLEVPLNIALSPHPRWELAQPDQPSITLTRAHPDRDLTLYVKPKRGTFVVETVDEETGHPIPIDLEYTTPNGPLRAKSGEPLKDLEIGTTLTVRVVDAIYELVGGELKDGPNENHPDVRTTVRVSRRRGMVQLACVDEQDRKVSAQFLVNDEPRSSGRDFSVPFGQDIEVKFADDHFDLLGGQQTAKFRLSPTEPRRKLEYRVKGKQPATPEPGRPTVKQCLVTVDAVEEASGKQIEQVPLNVDGNLTTAGFSAYKPQGARLTITCPSDKWELHGGKPEYLHELPRDKEFDKVAVKFQRKESTLNLTSTPIEATLKLTPVPDPGCSGGWYVEEGRLTVRTNHGPVRLPVGTYRIVSMEASEGFSAPRDVTALQVPGETLTFELLRHTKAVILQTSPPGAQVSLKQRSPLPGDADLVKQAEQTAWPSGNKISNAQLYLPLSDFDVSYSREGCVPVECRLRVAADGPHDMTSGQMAEWKAVKMKPERGKLTFNKVLPGAKWTLVPLDWQAYESREAMQEAEKERLQGTVLRPKKGEAKAELADIPVGRYQLVVGSPEGVRCKEDPIRREVEVKARGITKCEVKQEPGISGEHRSPGGSIAPPPGW